MPPPSFGVSRFFHNAQELEEFSGTIAEIEEGNGYFLAALKPQ